MIFRLYKSSSEEDNSLHQIYWPYYKNIRIVNLGYTIHSQNGIINSITGNFYTPTETSVTPIITASDALANALSQINATKYYWQLDGKASYYPQGELIMLPITSSNATTVFKLCYLFEITAIEPKLISEYVFVDANTNIILRRNSKLNYGDAQGTAQTRYNGTKTIYASLNPYIGTSNYILTEYGDISGRKAMRTGDSKNTSLFNVDDLYDNDNNWTQAEHRPTNDDVALDVHWGGEVCYDYFKLKFGRLGYNGLPKYPNEIGNTINTVHFRLDPTESFANALYLRAYDRDPIGFCIFGDGDANTNPFVSLDMYAHEYAHGFFDFTNYSAGFHAQKTYGALQESLSDMWASIIENWATPQKNHWVIGEEITKNGLGIRNLGNPHSLLQPNTIGGLYWINQDNCNPIDINDQCGVHTNAGVMNYWYYLLCQGGSGINDLGDNYQVNGIGIDEVAQLLYKVENGSYLDNIYYYEDKPLSLYEPLRENVLLAAKKLFGANSCELIAITNAFYAIGIGAKSSAILPNIIGKPIACTQEVYSLSNLPSGASVVWSLPSSSGSTFTLLQNTPLQNQVTLINHKYYALTTNLVATVTGLTICNTSYNIVKPLFGDNETSINKPFNYLQESCLYYNVNHSSSSGTIVSNAAPVFVHQGCMVYVGLGDLKGATVSVNPQPTYWSTGTTNYFSGTTLMFKLGLNSGGIPYTFKISNNNNGACYDNRTLLFFSKTANGRFASPNRFVISKHPSLANTLTIGLNQTTSDEIAKLFFDATALQAEQVQTVNIYDKDGTKVLQTDNVATQVTNLDVSTLPEGVYTVEVFGNNDYKELQTFQYITTGSEQQLAEDVATDNLNIYSSNAAAIVDVLHQELYQRLRENTDLLNNSSTLQSFFLAQQQGGLETIEQINNALSSYDVATAQTLINNWLPQSQLELNCLQYYNFFIKYLNGGTFNNTEISDLYGLANLCPQTNGEIIFAARSLYNYVTQLDEHFPYACGNNLNARGTKHIDMAAAKVGVNAISIYPNPAKGNFSIKFPATTKGINTVKVLDMYGKILIQQTIISGTQHINISQTLATGIYTVQITNSITGKTENQKLIIE